MTKAFEIHSILTVLLLRHNITILIADQYIVINQLDTA